MQNICGVCVVFKAYLSCKDSDRMTFRSFLHPLCFLKVTWSNGEMRDVHKSYQELYEFHTKVRSTVSVGYLCNI